MNSKQKIVVIDYGMGNLRSVAKILARLNVVPIITDSKEDVMSADKIILPGVGAFPKAMENLQDLGLIDTLATVVNDRKRPFLGICLGMQLLANESNEGEITEGLGWIDARVKRFNRMNGLRIPHMGWNSIEMVKETPLFRDLRGRPTFYFTHSYNMQCSDDDCVVGTCEYGEKFVAVVQKGNIFGTQFHPEKSQVHGRIMLENFLWLGN